MWARESAQNLPLFLPLNFIAFAVSFNGRDSSRFYAPLSVWVVCRDFHPEAQEIPEIPDPTGLKRGRLLMAFLAATAPCLLACAVEPAKDRSVPLALRSIDPLPTPWCAIQALLTVGFFSPAAER